MIITLTTDFGLSDPFVGIMKGVILSIAPTVHIVDITHDIRAYDILGAGLIVNSAYRYFPDGSVHVVIVDPGVGGTRRAIAVASKGHIFVGPDNGLLSVLVHDEPTTPIVHEITNRQFFLSFVSRTFHGRDIFAPIAAHLARGVAIDSLGPRIFDMVKKSVPAPQKKGNKLTAVVMRLDKFGNIITNLRPDHLLAGFKISIDGMNITRLCATFSEGKPGELFAIEGSTGYVEFALNQASAADRLNVEPGTEIEVETEVTNQ